MDCYNACVAQDSKTTELLRSHIDALQAIYELANTRRGISKRPNAVCLCLASAMIYAEPFHRFRPPQREQIAEILRSLPFDTGHLKPT